MGHENLSLTQIVIDLVKEKWPLHPWKPRDYMRHALDFPIEAAIDYDLWPCVYILSDTVFIVKDLETVPDPVRGTTSKQAVQIRAADPQFVAELEQAVEAYLKMIPKYLFLP